MYLNNIQKFTRRQCAVPSTAVQMAHFNNWVPKTGLVPISKKTSLELSGMRIPVYCENETNRTDTPREKAAVSECCSMWRYMWPYATLSYRLNIANITTTKKSNLLKCHAVSLRIYKITGVSLNCTAFTIAGDQSAKTA
jgi:hypothetical protein